MSHAGRASMMAVIRLSANVQHCEAIRHAMLSLESGTKQTKRNNKAKHWKEN